MGRVERIRSMWDSKKIIGSGLLNLNCCLIDCSGLIGPIYLQLLTYLNYVLLELLKNPVQGKVI